MILTDMQPVLLQLVQGIALLTGYSETLADGRQITGPDLVMIDDGDIVASANNALAEPGLFIEILAPQGEQVFDHTRGAAAIEYVAAVWIRTNPKVKSGGVAKWNPLEIEKQVLEAVIEFSKTIQGGFGFHILPGMEPKQDFFDPGNNSRIVWFATKVTFK